MPPLLGDSSREEWQGAPGKGKHPKTPGAPLPPSPAQGEHTQRIAPGGAQELEPAVGHKYWNGSERMAAKTQEQGTLTNTQLCWIFWQLTNLPSCEKPYKNPLSIFPQS